MGAPIWRKSARLISRRARWSNTRSSFIPALKVRDIERRRFTVVVDYAYGRIATVLPELLGRLGCTVISLNAYSDWNRAPKTPVERQALMYNLSQVVLTLRADLGIMLYSDGERMALVDEKGGALQEATLLAVMASLVSQTRPGARVAAPVTAPSVIEAVVRRTGGSAARTKTDPRFLMTLSSLPAEKIALAGI